MVRTPSERHLDAMPVATGEVDLRDWQVNEETLSLGLRLLSVYRAEGSDERFWIVTEADRSITTVLFPDEY